MSRDFSTLMICFAQKVECIMNSYFRQNVKLGLSSARAKHQWLYRRVGAERGEQHRILASGCQSGQNKRHRWALKPLVPLVTPSPFVPLIIGHWTGFCTSQRLKKKIKSFFHWLKKYDILLRANSAYVMILSYIKGTARTQDCIRHFFATLSHLGLFFSR